MSENSSSSGSDEDTTSVTSWEDMSTLDPNMLLFKAAQARNLPVMLEALANRADPNWVSVDNEDKTPIMKAIETVGCHSSLVTLTYREFTVKLKVN